MTDAKAQPVMTRVSARKKFMGGHKFAKKGDLSSEHFLGRTSLKCPLKKTLFCSLMGGISPPCQNHGGINPPVPPPSGGGPDDHCYVIRP